MSRFPAPSALTLHRPPALLVDAVLECAATGGRVRLLRGFADDPLALLEAAAQAAAVLAGAAGHAAGAAPRPGALVAARAFTVVRGAISDETLEIAIVWGAALGALRQAEATIHDAAGAVVMRGTLAVAEGVEIAAASSASTGGGNTAPPAELPLDRCGAGRPVLDFAPRRQAETAVLSWRAQAPGAAAATLSFPSTLPLFAGHFPGRPLVPGVHLLAGVLVAVRCAAGGEWGLREVERAKWSGAVRPGDQAEIAARWQDQADFLAVDATLSVGATLCMSCRMALRRLPVPP